MKKDKKGRNHFIFYSVLIFAIVALVYYLIMNVEVLYNGIGIRLEQLISGVSGTGEFDSSAEIRVKLRNIAFEKWTDSPVYGYGFDSFKYYSKAVTGRFYYSHCNYTELLYNGGIIGIIVYYSFYFIMLRRAIIDKKIPLNLESSKA
jgi:O-antigen ligase